VNNQNFLDTLAQTSVTMTHAALSKGSTQVGLDGLIRHLSSILDFETVRQRNEAGVELDCKAGCDSCCYEAVLASAPEILSIYYFLLDTLKPDEIEALKAKLADYEASVAPHRDEPYYFGKTACPLLDNHHCSVYELRPFMCRGRNSKDVNACEILKDAPGEMPMFPLFEPQWQAANAVFQGVNYALAGLMQQGRFELGQSLKMLFDRPGLDSAIMDGKSQFPVPARLVKPMNFEARPNDVTIKSPTDHALFVSPKMADKGMFADIDKILDDNNVLHVFGKLRLPHMYASVEEILEARGRFSKSLDRLEEMNFDPKEAVNALSYRLLMGLPEQGMTVKDLVARHGKLIVDKITSKVYPHLSEPLGKRKSGKFRVGYLSANLNNNNGAKWALGWLKAHGSDFETYAFNAGPRADIISRRFGEAADHYHQVTGELQPAAEWIRSLDLDALIFTDIGTRAGDGQFATLRLARTQCTAWGMPCSSGLPTMDYYLSSDLMEPKDAQSEYTEKLIRLPNSGLIIARPKAVVHPRSRSDFGLEDGFLPMMAQGLFKWAPQNDELLARIQQRFGKPLVMIGFPLDDDLAIFESRMIKHGIEFKFLPRTDMIGYNRYLQMADVSFDPPTWSGGNTTVEAITMGLPVVTLPGEFMRGRHSYAFNKISGLDGLIAKNEDDFIDLIFDQDRQREAMKKANPDAIFEDKSVAESLNKFLLGAAEGL
jgi:hypothetical protein